MAGNTAGNRRCCCCPKALLSYGLAAGGDSNPRPPPALACGALTEVTDIFTTAAPSRGGQKRAHRATGRAIRCRGTGETDLPLRAPHALPLSYVRPDGRARRIRTFGPCGSTK